MARKLFTHLLYSAGIVSSDNYLFLFLLNCLHDNNFNFLEDFKSDLEQFFIEKDKRFWEDAIMKLPKRWKKIVEQNDKYIFITYKLKEILPTPNHDVP